MFYYDDCMQVRLGEEALMPAPSSISNLIGMVRRLRGFR